MKETNSLEIRLRSWDLRRPSDEIKRRLFPARTSAERISILLTWRWIAPAVTCAFLALIVVNQPGGTAPSPHRESPQTFASSNVSACASLSNELDRAGSNLPARPFEYTNRSDTTSTIGGWMPVKLN